MVGQGVREDLCQLRYTWRMPRSAARKRMRSISMISAASQMRIDRAELDREVGSIAAGNQVTDTFRHCPSCDAEQFEQTPWRSPAG
jgi:hypothetical protein